MSAERFNDRVARLVEVRSVLREMAGLAQVQVRLDHEAAVCGEASVARLEQITELRETLASNGLVSRTTEDEVSIPDGGQITTDEVSVRFIEDAPNTDS